MGSMNNLEMSIVNVNGHTNKEVLNALSELMEFDLDFTGENGPDYLWEEAKGFESNRDYLLNEVAEYDCLSDMIDEYIETAMTTDNYYEDFKYHTSWDSQGNLIDIVLVYLIRD